MLRQENYETIQIEKQDGVAILTLNRPERLNAVNGAMWSGRSRAFAWFGDDLRRHTATRELGGLR